MTRYGCLAGGPLVDSSSTCRLIRARLRDDACTACAQRTSSSFHSVCRHFGVPVPSRSIAVPVSTVRTPAHLGSLPPTVIRTRSTHRWLRARTHRSFTRISPVTRSNPRTKRPRGKLNGADTPAPGPPVRRPGAFRPSPMT